MQLTSLQVEALRGTLQLLAACSGAAGGRRLWDAAVDAALGALPAPLAVLGVRASDTAADAKAALLTAHPALDRDARDLGDSSSPAAAATNGVGAAWKGAEDPSAPGEDEIQFRGPLRHAAQHCSEPSNGISSETSASSAAEEQDASKMASADPRTGISESSGGDGSRLDVSNVARLRSACRECSMLLKALTSPGGVRKAD